MVYAKFHALFISSHTSKSAAENALQAYNILPTSSEEAFFEALTRVSFYTTMIYKACHAGKFFKTQRRKQALLSGQDPNPLGVPCYSVELANPFPGREQGIAHHGVEVVYAFGTFHQALDKANRGVSVLVATTRLVGSVLNMPLECVLFNTEILVSVSLDKGLELYLYLATSPWSSHVSDGRWPLFIHSSDEQASLEAKGLNWVSVPCELSSGGRDGTCLPNNAADKRHHMSSAVKLFDTRLVLALASRFPISTYRTTGAQKTRY